MGNIQRLLSDWQYLEQLWSELRSGGPTKERNAGIDGDAQSLAIRAQEEPLPYKGREDHAGHHYQDDPYPSVHLVRQRPTTPQEGEQNDLGAKEPQR